MKKRVFNRFKTKNFFEELANRTMEEIQDLNRQIDINKLTYHYQSKSIPKKAFVGFKGPLDFYKNIKIGHITLEKADEKQEEFKEERKNFSKT